MKKKFRFERLECWQQARVLNREIYKMTRRFPKDEIYSMSSQVRRASTSISSNIAEGSGRNSDKDFAHFLEQAYGSAMEVASLLFLALDERYINESEADVLLETIAAVAAKVAALNRSLNVPTSKTRFSRRDASAFDVRRSTFD
jgi:four helix bundle protein